MNREKIKEIEQMTWDALHKLAAKATDNGKRKQKYLRVLSDICDSFL